MKLLTKNRLAGLLLIPVLALGSMMFSPVAFAKTEAECRAIFSTEIEIGACVADSGGPTDLTAMVKNITNVAFYIIGVLAVLMLIYGGIRYTMSGGDSKAVESAKNTIMYAIIGIIVALLSLAIVNFVIGSILK